jgi:UDP-3-O-[3-hydroxymyristoyl] glucosamine N-acyltransferase
MRPGVRSFSLGELIDLLGGELVGSREARVVQVAPLDTAGPEHISFLVGEAYRKALSASRAGVVVMRRGADVPERACILTDNPYAYFVRVAQLLNPAPEVEPSVHPLASVHPNARVAASAQIGPFASIEAGAQIGERVRVGPGCRIGADAAIGDDSNLHANVSVYADCIVGQRAVLNAGCVVGSDGFGGALDDGRWLKMPHIGRVVIGDDVDIGANTTIDRGAMADTIIGDGVKLDNLVQIGHNVRVGDHTTIAGCAGVAGSTWIGAHCVIGGAAMLMGHLRLADRVQITAGTAVMSSIDVPGRYSGIYPASEHRAWLKSAAGLRRLGGAGGKGRKNSGLRPQRTEEDHDNAD